MINRQTAIVFHTPRGFEPTKSESFRRADGTVATIDTAFIKGDTRTAINGREIQCISRRGHLDPAKAREIALAKGATGDDIEVSYHEIRNLRSTKVAKFVVNTLGELKPIKVTA